MPTTYANGHISATGDPINFMFCSLTLRPERQSPRMSKITNDGLTRSGILDTL